MTDEAVRGLDRQLAYAFWGKLRESQKQDVARSVGIERPFCGTTLETDKAFLRAVVAQNKTGAVRAAVARHLPTPEPAQPAESPEARAHGPSIDGMTLMQWSNRLYDLGQDMAPDLRERFKDKLGAFQDRLAKVLAATTARPTERGAVDIDQRADDYAAEYVMSTEGNDYVPTEWERELIIDALHGFIADYWNAALTPPVTVAATDQAGEVERLRELSDAATVGPWKLFEYLRGAFEICQADNYASGGVGQAVSRANGEFIVACVNHVRAALDTQPATGRTMGGEVWRNDMDTAKHGQNVVLNSDSPLWLYPFVGFWNAETNWWEFSDPNMAGCFSVSELVNQWLPLPAAALQNGGE